MKHTLRKRTRLLSLFLSLILMFSACIVVQLQAGADTLSEAENRLSMLQSQYNTAKEQREEANATYQAALREYSAKRTNYENALALKEALDNEISQMEAEVDATYALIDEYNVQIADYKTQIAAKEAEIAEKYELFKERVRLNYEDSYVSYLELIFTSESFSDFLTRMDLVGNMMDYDARVMEELDTAKQELAQMQTQTEALQVQASQKLTELEATIPQLEQKKEENLAVLDDLQSAYAEASSAYNDASAIKSDADSEVSDLAKRIAQAEAEVAAEIARQQEASKDTEYQGSGSGMQWPVDAAYRKISSGFGYRTDPFGSGSSAYHNGIDMPCPYGSNIYAAESGTVTIATYHFSYGNYIVIDHGGGISTLYAHNSSLKVSVGQKVTRGQVIAAAGGTGAVTGVHCHFCVIVNGQHVNPLGYLG